MQFFRHQWHVLSKQFKSQIVLDQSEAASNRRGLTYSQNSDTEDEDSVNLVYLFASVKSKVSKLIFIPLIRYSCTKLRGYCPPA